MTVWFKWFYIVFKFKCIIQYKLVRGEMKKDSQLANDIKKLQYQLSYS